MKSWACCVALAAWFVGQAFAADITVQGSALITNGDTGQAREQASRRALARAAEFRSASISAQTTLAPGMAIESVQLNANACTENIEQIDEKINGNELTVTLKVSVLDKGSCHKSCRGAYTNRIVVTGFALEYPEQKLLSEDARISNFTSLELSKILVRREHLLSEHESTAFPYSSPSKAPAPLMGKKDKESPFAILARKNRGQYILSGVYRDFGIQDSFWSQATRRIEIEAFLHDGANGEVLARQRFMTEAKGAVILENKPSIGTAAFYQTDFGKTWGELLDRIAAWTEQNASCLPFIARVLNSTGNTIHIDAGAESGLSAGDSLNLHQWRDPPVLAVTGIALGREKNGGTSATIKSVYPKFSILELSNQPNRLEVHPGDILYAQ